MFALYEIYEIYVRLDSKRNLDMNLSQNDELSLKKGIIFCLIGIIFDSSLKLIFYRTQLPISTSFSGCKTTTLPLLSSAANIIH